MFDKVIVLSEGRTIYHGAPDEIRTYFERPPFRYAIGLYCNPADKLMTLASHPKRCIHEKIQSEVKSSGEQIALLNLEAACRDAVQKSLKLTEESKEKLDLKLNVNTMKESVKVGQLS